VIHHLQQSRDVHFLSLDADRAYPKRDINVNQLASAYEIDWTGTEYTRGRAFKPTTTLYDEWIKYFLAMENQAGTRLMQDTRRARKAGSEPPVFSDHFDDYATSLQTVLPHVVFTGVEPKKRTLLFDTTGLHLTFDQLSGGEREIAFLIGQIDRFGLRRGLFLLDEPELHLNADLIRSWVAYLTSTISTGQVWLATHSLEAVEAAGQHATFVLERDNVSRTVDRVARLDERPVLSALSRAVGTPAFSISQLVFVFVEGEEAVGERERFRKLAGMPQHIRFVECSSCNEVQRRVSAVRALAAESDAGIRIGGIVDRDFRSNADAEALRAGAGILVLPVHEIENLFLHPATLERILRQIGRTDVSPVGAIQAAADARAGSWVFQYSMATSLADDLPPIPEATKQRAKSMTWDHIARDGDAAIREITAASRFEATDADRYAKMLKVGINAYERKRQESDLWKLCEGKQVLPMIARTAGFAGPPALMSASYAVWDSEPELIPEELVELRRYLEAL
jgi:hypothetical protein